MEWIAAIKKRETECDASLCERKCFYYVIAYCAKLFLAPASRVPANVVFLVKHEGALLGKATCIISQFRKFA